MTKDPNHLRTVKLTTDEVTVLSELLEGALGGYAPMRPPGQVTTITNLRDELADDRRY